MPALKNYAFLLLLISALFLSDCKKDNYRKKYAGSWTFNFILVSCNQPNPCDTNRTAYTGKISLGTSGDDALNIEYSSGGNPGFTVDKSGKLGGCGVSGVSGSFDGSSKVSFIRDFSSTCGGALGGWSSFTVTGTKN